MNNKKNILRIMAANVLLALTLALSGCPEAPAPIFTCANGTAQTGAAPGSINFEQCVSCNSGFKLEGARGGDRLDGARCIATAYTCVNGTPAAGSPAGNSDAPQCARCAEGFLLTASATCVIDLDNDGVINALDVDDDGDGLIEIRNLNELNNMRFNLAGTGYRTTSGGVNDSTGCGTMAGNSCSGYELMRSLDFADGASYADGSVNSAWRPNNDNPDNATNEGWQPIGDNTGQFAATFEGNGHTISNLYARGGDGQDYIGLFGWVTTGTTLRNIGIVDYRLYGGGGQDFIGGLVGQQESDIITASYTIGNADGGDGGDRIGGLVGRAVNVRITASYAIITGNGGDGNSDLLGGLVGFLTNNTNTYIIASYATATLNGGAGNDIVGGLVGYQFDSGNDNIITASYATGAADGGASTGDNVGRLVGANENNDGTITASYGFATTENGTANMLGSHPNSAVNSAVVLTEAGSSAPTASTTNAGPQWTNSATNPTWQWDFGTNTQNPALVVDFNGDGTATWQEFGSQPRN